MSPPNIKSKVNAQIYEEACEWLVHFRAGDADDDVSARKQLDEWLRRSPEHVRAYLEVSAIWEDVASHDAARKIDAEAHIARALSEASIVSLNAPGAAGTGVSERSKSTRARRGMRGWAAAAVAALAVVGAASWNYLHSPTYATAVGEQRSITLDDGSSVELNARSRLRVRFTEDRRLVDLLEGQALFRVTKDPTRPFVVVSDKMRVRAVGTQFDVNRRQSTTTVTVIEGRVGVDPSAAGARMFAPVSAARDRNYGAEVFLDAGQQLTVTPKAASVPRRVNIATATAWTQRQLIFDSAPLAEVAEEFNRYNKRPIVIHDRTLDAFGVIGVFSSADSAALVKFLRAQPEIEVTETGSEVAITRR